MDFEVVILGSDVNAYYMARNCYEEYGKKAYLIGMTPMNFTRYSTILNITYEPNLHDAKTMIKVLKHFARDHENKKLLLIGSNDNYVRLIIENQDVLKDYYYFHTFSIDLLNNFLIKDKFYSVYSNIDIPKTYIYNISSKINFKKIAEINYPLILKPGNGIDYHDHEFSGQAKVYKIKNKEKLTDTVKQIKESGYKGNLIIQKFIEGDDSNLFDCIAYCDRFGKVKLMSFAQIGLQEHTHTGIGNCTLLVNGYNQYGNTKKTIEKLKEFIESTGYHGICEFDLKYDPSDKIFKILEINPRQARSSYYLTACGYNLVRYLVDDLILEKKLDYHFIDNKMCLSFVPKKVIKEFVSNNNLKEEVLNLIKEKKCCDPLNCSKDKSIKRKLWLKVRKYNYVKKYRKCKW